MVGQNNFGWAKLTCFDFSSSNLYVGGSLTEMHLVSCILKLWKIWNIQIEAAKSFLKWLNKYSNKKNWLYCQWHVWYPVNLASITPDSRVVLELNSHVLSISYVRAKLKLTGLYGCMVLTFFPLSPTLH